MRVVAHIDFMIELRAKSLCPVMVDTNSEAMSSFFHGSTGGQTTFHMLAAIFMQPHLSLPFLDGLILLYNGEILSE